VFNTGVISPVESLHQAGNSEFFARKSLITDESTTFLFIIRKFKELMSGAFLCGTMTTFRHGFCSNHLRQKKLRHSLSFSLFVEHENVKLAK
jgi:hypothetical protein